PFSHSWSMETTVLWKWSPFTIQTPESQSGSSPCKTLRQTASAAPTIQPLTSITSAESDLTPSEAVLSSIASSSALGPTNTPTTRTCRSKPSSTSLTQTEQTSIAVAQNSFAS